MKPAPPVTRMDCGIARGALTGMVHPETGSPGDSPVPSGDPPLGNQVASRQVAIGVRSVPLRSAQPQVDRLRHFRRERQRDLLPGARGSVRGVDQFEHGASVLARDAGGLVGARALDEVLQLLGVTLVERLLEDGESPALACEAAFSMA